MDRVSAYFEQQQNLVADYLQTTKQNISQTALKEPSIRNNLLGGFASLCQQAGSAQQSGQKQAIHYISFAYLRSAIRCGSNDICLSLLDTEKWYLDLAPCTVYVRLDWLFKQQQQDYDFFIAAAKKALIRLKPYEMDIFFRKYCDVYFSYVQEICAGLLPELLQIAEWQQIEKAGAVEILFGEFLGDKCQLKSNLEWSGNNG